MSHQYLGLVQPAFDLVVADEVQDITDIQLRLILASRTESGQLLLCGDSNRIVHQDFFSWTSLKSKLYREETDASSDGFVKTPASTPVMAAGAS